MCTALCRGAVFCCTLLHCLPPQGQCCVSSLDVTVGQDGGHKRKYAAMLQSSSRAGVKVSMLSLPSRRPVPLFGWLVFSVSIFAGWPSWGASRPDGKKDSLKFRGESSGSKKLLDLKGESPLAGTFVVKTRLWTCRYEERFHIPWKRNFLSFWRGA